MHDPYEVLVLEASAGRLEVARAYRRLKELYSQDSLAIYSLLTELERKDRLEQIESAYRSILDLLRSAMPVITPPWAQRLANQTLFQTRSWQQAPTFVGRGNRRGSQSGSWPIAPRLVPPSWKI